MIFLYNYNAGDDMIVDITRLRSGIDKIINFSFTYDFSEEELKKMEINKLDDLKVEGYVKLDALKEVCVNIDITGTMIIPCAITLKPVNYPFKINVEGEVSELESEFDEKIKKSQNTLDIFPIIWENILMEVPMRVVSEDAENYEASGEGWQFTTKDCERENSELSKLKDLL